MTNRLVIEQIGTEQTLREGATAEDLAFVEQFGSESRRREVMAWRAVVRRELGGEVAISHDEYGAPMLSLPNINISVSHSKDKVAVLFSQHHCAVDIEHSGRDFRRVASRYLSVAEQQMAEHYDLYAEMWCAKEALYKYHRKGELDLVKDVAIVECDEGVLRCSILGGAMLEVRVWREGEITVAVID